MREFSKKRYLLTLVLTGFIFVFGLMLGLIIEGARTGYLEDISAQQTLEYNSLQLQYEFIDQLGQDGNCKAISKTFDHAVESLENARVRLEEYNQDSTLNKEEFDNLKREYALAQIRYWMLARETKELCDMELSTILYFYSTKEKCPKCEQQAFMLTYLKKKFDDRLLNFALDGDYENELMIQILKDTYDVTEFPTIIVDDKKFDGLTDKETILKEICKNYSPTLEECQLEETTVVVKSE